MTQAENERLARLEERVSSLTKSVEALTAQNAELLAVLNQAKGAKWAILGVVALASTLTTLAVHLGLKSA